MVANNVMELLGRTSKDGKHRRTKRQQPERMDPSAPLMRTKAESTAPLSPLTIGVQQAATTSGLSLRYLRAQIKSGKLRTILCGRRVLVPVDALKEFLGLN